MNSSCFVLVSLLAVLAVAVRGEHCDPSSNCKLPRCRCWDDPKRPGDVKEEYTPQIVMITFGYAMNNLTLNEYLPLFDGLANPNGCPPKGTFFSQDLDTKVDSLKKLFELGHEIGLTTSDGKIPRNKREWVESLFKSSEKLYDAGIPRDKMKGVRSPNQFEGGNDEMQALSQFGMDYECSCLLYKSANSVPGWPFTYDFPEGAPRCSIGVTPNSTYKGIWQFVSSEMNFRGRQCSTLSGCSPAIESSLDAFTFLFDMFSYHFYNGRAPLVINIDPQWLTRKEQVKGTKQFLELITGNKNVWLVSMTQALEWVKFPVPMYGEVKFWPWECSQKDKITTLKKLQRARGF